MKWDVTGYGCSEFNNSILTGEVGMGLDGHFAHGEEWTKTCGPWFLYLNDVPPNITKPARRRRDALRRMCAQADAEFQAWPYRWFKHPTKCRASGRCAGHGQDRHPRQRQSQRLRLPFSGYGSGWEPQTSIRDPLFFQKWLKPYQFLGADPGRVEPRFHHPPCCYRGGTDYTLWWIRIGGGGDVSVSGSNGAAIAVGAQPSRRQDVAAGELRLTCPRLRGALRARVGRRCSSSVIRTGKMKFRHGDDPRRPAPVPKLGYPTPVWGRVGVPVSLSPDGMTYAVGKSQWATDWNYVSALLCPTPPGFTSPARAKSPSALAQGPAE